MTMFVSHFVELDLWVEKEEMTEKGDIYFGKGGSGKFQVESVCFFFVNKRIAFKNSLDLHFYTLIIAFFRFA